MQGLGKSCGSRQPTGGRAGSLKRIRPSWPGTQSSPAALLTGRGPLTAVFWSPMIMLQTCAMPRGDHVNCTVHSPPQHESSCHSFPSKDDVRDTVKKSGMEHSRSSNQCPGQNMLRKGPAFHRVKQRQLAGLRIGLCVAPLT